MESSLNKPVSTPMLIKFALPTILSMVVMSIFAAIDGIFVGRLVSMEGLAAVNLVMPFLTVILAVGSMLAMGGSALVAKKKGEGNDVEARQNFSLILIVAFVVSAVLALISNVFVEPLLSLLGTNTEMHDITLEYLRPIVLFLPFPLLGMLMPQFMIANGKPTLGGIMSTSGAVLNTILNWIFLSPLDMGIGGAAWASIIGYSMPTVFGLLYFVFNRKGGLYFVKPTWDFAALVKSSTNGISEFISMIAFSIVGTVMNNRLMDIEGWMAVSAFGIIMAVQGLLTSVFMGYSFGIAPIISYNYGAENTDGLKKAYSISLRVVAVLSLFAVVIGLIFAGPLVRIYVDTSIPWNVPVYELAARGFRIGLIGFVFAGFNVFASAMFTALNNGLVSGTLSIFRTFIFMLGTVLVFSHLWGVTGVFWALPIAEVLAIFMTVFFFKKMRRTYNYA